MAAIEHRQKDSVMACYDHFNEPNWGIFYGTEPRDNYCEGDSNDARVKLDSYLDMIYGMAINQTYTLRVYPATSAVITTKTPFSKSTTFNFSNSNLPRGEGGAVTINNPIPMQNYAAAANAATTAKMDQLTDEINKLKDQLYRKEIDSVKTDFANQIAGIRDKEPDLSFGDKMLKFLENLVEKPEVVEKIGYAIRGAFKPNKDYIQHTSQVSGSISGTDKTATDMSHQATAQPYINELLTPEERKLDAEHQSKLTIERLTPISQEEHDDLQSECLQNIEARIGAITLSRMLIAVACLNDKEMNKLINHLD